MPNYPKKEILNLYKELPERLKNAISSEKTADIIYNSCVENNISKDEEISQVAKNVGYVLIGLASPQELKKNLAEDTNFKKETIDKLYKKINDLIFFPLKDILERLYDIKINLISKIEDKTLTNIEDKSQKNDTYREPID